MDPKSQETFDRIVSLDPESLTDQDRDFLRARRSYLTPAQEKAFAGVLDSEGDAPSEKPLAKMNLAELTAKAKELGVEVAEGATKAEVKEAIEAKIAETAGQ